jgi:outer membrane protein TolC
MAAIAAGLTLIGAAQVSQTPATTGVTRNPFPANVPTAGAGQNPLAGSVPTGAATGDILDLSLEDAISRGLKYNLGLVEGDENVSLRRAERLRALSQMLPTIDLRPSVTEQQVNLAAFGFTAFPGVPPVIGPFTVYNAQANFSQTVYSARNLRNYRAAQKEVTAAEFNARDIREQVVTVVTGLYLQGIASAAQIEAQQSQVTTAETAYRQAVDRRNAGTVPGIDVLRAQVELQAEQQQLIAYEGDFERRKLNLARTIGLPPGQQFRLADTAPYTPLPADVTVESALQQAYRQRQDYRAAEALVQAGELSKAAARAGRYPTVSLDGNYAVLGNSITQSHGAFVAAGAVDIPIFQGGRIRADVEQADSVLRRRRAELDDLRGRIDADVRLAFIDLRSASRQVEVAVSGVNLATQQLQQARDRFAAGVTNNLEVVQAQQALALANQNHIAALYAYNLAKTALVRARGDAERSIKDYLRRVP